MADDNRSPRAAALAARAAGLCVMPPVEDGTKRPAGRGTAHEWRSLQTRPPTDQEFDDWYGPCTGLGVVAGAASGNLEVFEFDDADAYTEFKALAHHAEMDDLISLLEEGYSEGTPNGGVHWLYRCPSISANTKLASRLQRADEQQGENDKVKTLIETRGQGGYCILAPSNGRVHPSGKPYVLQSGGFDTIPTITPQQRDDLHRLARCLDELPPKRMRVPVRDRRASGARERPGDDFNRRTTWSDVLGPHGWQSVSSRGDATSWRRPGKHFGISATTNSWGADLLFVFSTSTLFEAGRTYDRFGAHAVLEHGGDLRAAAQSLAAQGYGRASGSAMPSVEVRGAMEAGGDALTNVAVVTVTDGAVERGFLRKDDKIVADALDNIRLAVSTLGVSQTYDEFSHVTLIDGRPADDFAVDSLWVRIDDTFKFRPSKETLRTLLVVDARNAPFHPVTDYLDGLVWDETRRLDDWLVTYGGATPSAYVCAVGALPLIAAVRRARHPGAKFDELLILESGQGTLKSTALRTLCPNEEWFSDDLPLGVDSKQVIERTGGKSIIEAAEMYGNRGREAEQLKAFLSRQVDGPARLAYRPAGDDGTAAVRACRHDECANGVLKGPDGRSAILAGDGAAVRHSRAAA